MGKLAGAWSWMKGIAGAGIALGAGLLTVESATDKNDGKGGALIQWGQNQAKKVIEVTSSEQGRNALLDGFFLGNAKFAGMMGFISSLVSFFSPALGAKMDQWLVDRSKNITKTSLDLRATGNPNGLPVGQTEPSAHEKGLIAGSSAEKAAEVGAGILAGKAAANAMNPGSAVTLGSTFMAAARGSGIGMALGSAATFAWNKIIGNDTKTAVQNTLDGIPFTHAAREASQGNVGTAARSAATDTAIVAGGIGGAWAGAAAGAAVGSVVPFVGTAIGGIVGGIAGSLAGSYGAGEVVDFGLSAIFGRAAAPSSTPLPTPPRMPTPIAVPAPATP